MNEEPERPSLLARFSEAGSSLAALMPISKQSVDVRAIFTAAVVGGGTLFVVWNVSPWLWFTDTTPTGGDLGAHVWAPAYLRDELLPNFRLAGWSPDWYGGFPAFTFYMVIPSLLIVINRSALGGRCCACGISCFGLVLGGANPEGDCGTRTRCWERTFRLICRWPGFPHGLVGMVAS